MRAMLAKNPSQRPALAQVVATLVREQDALRGAPIDVLGRPTLPIARRLRVAIGATVAGALAIAAGVAAAIA